MILAELSGRVALVLEACRDGDDAVGHALRRGRNADFRQSRAVDALSGDEGRAASRAGLLTVAVGEHHAFIGDAVDIGRLIAHQTARVAAQIRDADIVAPDNEDVWLLAGLAVSFGHDI